MGLFYSNLERGPPRGRAARIRTLIRRWTGNARLLADDVAKEFPDSASVNEALRLVMAMRAMRTKRRGKAA